MYIQIENIIDNIKCPKSYIYKNIIYIFGIESICLNNKTSYNIILKIYDSRFNFIYQKTYKFEHLESSMVRCVYNVNSDDNIFVIINKHISSNNILNIITYLYKFDINDNTLVFEKKINTKENIILHYHINNYEFSSKIEIDEERPDYFWGKYLFLFNINSLIYQPIFDNIVDYTKDKGHLLHYFEKLEKEYLIIFSIRHKEPESENYFYKIYNAKSQDLYNFYNTCEILIENTITESKWYCYPNILKTNGEYYVLINQDDFGKTKKTLFGKIIV